MGSKKGAPGGGAAAALTGAVGVALVEMVARLNDARLTCSSGRVKKAVVLRRKMQGLIQKAAKAFEQIQKIYGRRHQKPIAWQRALKHGALVPLEIVEACAKAAKLARTEKPRTSRWLASDLVESQLLLKAASDAAILNVNVNLKAMKDKKTVSQIRKRLCS